MEKKALIQALKLTTAVAVIALVGWYFTGTAFLAFLLSKTAALAAAVWYGAMLVFAP